MDPVSEDASTRLSGTQCSGNMAEEGWRDCRGRRMREFRVRLCLLCMSEAAHINSHQHECLNVNKGHTSAHAKVDREKSIRLLFYTTNSRQPKKAGSLRVGPSQGRAHPSAVPYQKVSPENFHT